MLHYPFPTINIHINKINHYSQLGAENLFNKNKKTTLIYAVFSGIVKFIKMYLIKKGFLDGKEGFVMEATRLALFLMVGAYAYLEISLAQVAISLMVYSAINILILPWINRPQAIPEA
jgi:hypothetical protein